jgi:DNA helicase-2/ATP-dependent DNA helicase PcrA
VLAGRIAYLVGQRSVPPASVIAITFTTSAAAALRERLAGVLGNPARELTITTFHAFGLRLIKQWSGELGFGDFVPAVYGRDDARALVREAATDFGLEIAPDNRGRDSDPWAISLARLGHAVDQYRLGSNNPASNVDGWDDIDEELLRPLTAAYEALLQRRCAVDYPAMLTLPLRLFASEPRALRLMQDAYRCAVADEFQDTTRPQFRLLQQVVERHRNLAVVGDPMQSIHGWNGADPRILLDFSRAYPEARIFPLEQNHRSTGVIVAISNALAAPLDDARQSWTTNPAGPPARLYTATDEMDEARFVAREVVRLLESGQVEHPGQVAVLFRTNAQGRPFALSLRAAGVPYRVRADADLFVQPEVRDLVAYLRVAHSPADGSALARIINVPPRRLSMIEQAFRKRPVPVPELAVWAFKRGGPGARRAVEDLLAMLQDLHQSTLESRPAQALDAVLDKTGYAVWLSSQKEGHARLKRVEEFHSVLATSPAPDLGTWLVDMHLGEVESSSADDSQAVALCTIHTAKGNQWPVVFVAGFEDGLIPHVRRGTIGRVDSREDEERRLAYVAFSRSQVLLYLVHSQTRRSATADSVPRLEPRRVSRFLASLPPNLLQRVDDTRAA